MTNLAGKCVSDANLQKALLKLNAFCVANKIKYVVTGTMALSMLGIPSQPEDIDILIFRASDQQLSKLKELHDLAGIGNENYDGECYTFIINDIKINAIISKSEDSYEEPEKKIVAVGYINTKTHEKFYIYVHNVFTALEAKMKLGRYKDITYMSNLIKNLLSI